MDSSWSCVGENLLDVLIEMEREREKKEKVVSWIKVCRIHTEQWKIRSSLKSLWTFQLYWEIQLQLIVGNINTFSEVASPVVSSDGIHHTDSKTQEFQVWACRVAGFILYGITASVDDCLYFFSCTEAETVGKEKPFRGCEISEEPSEISQAILGQVSISRDIDLLHAPYGNHSKGRIFKVAKRGLVFISLGWHQRVCTA